MSIQLEFEFMKETRDGETISDVNSIDGEGTWSLSVAGETLTEGLSKEQVDGVKTSLFLSLGADGMTVIVEED